MKGYGVIPWQGKLLVYEPVNDGYRANFLGSETPEGISPELREAIEADRKRQAQKGEAA